MDMNSLSHTKWECKYHIVFLILTSWCWAFGKNSGYLQGSGKIVS